MKTEQDNLKRTARLIAENDEEAAYLINTDVVDLKISYQIPFDYSLTIDTSNLPDTKNA